MKTLGRLGVSLFFVASAATCGEKGKDKDKDKTEPTTAAVDDKGAAATGDDGPGNAKPGDGSGASPSDAKADAALAAMCETSCLLLTEHKLGDLDGDGYCKLCGEHDPAACSAPNPFAGDNCDQFDYQRNCVYAANGYKFKKKQWRDTFGKTDWYKEKDDFSEKDLTILETGNIRALRNRVSVCRGKALGEVSQKDKELVRAFFAKKEAGKLKLPKKLYLDGQPASEKEFRGFLATDGLFKLKKYTPISYSEWGPGGEVDRKKFRALNVSTGAPSPDCKETGSGEECEGFEWLEMLIDDGGNIVALGVSAAACPFLYAGPAADELSRVGEILRNLSRRSLEATQHLSLGEIDSCGAQVFVRVAEEKDERTYLDDVSLSIGGVAIAPRACSDPDARYCANDGRYHVIEKGEALDLVFDVSPELRCQPASVAANGYYIGLEPR